MPNRQLLDEGVDRLPVTSPPSLGEQVQREDESAPRVSPRDLRAGQEERLPRVYSQRAGTPPGAQVLGPRLAGSRSRGTAEEPDASRRTEVLGRGRAPRAVGGTGGNRTLEPERGGAAGRGRRGDPAPGHARLPVSGAAGPRRELPIGPRGVRPAAERRPRAERGVTGPRPRAARASQHALSAHQHPDPYGGGPHHGG